MPEPETAFDAALEKGDEGNFQTDGRPIWRAPEEIRKKYPNIEKILDLELPVIVVLAEKTCTLEEALALGEGSVIVFRKHNSQPLDILINNRKIGAGKTIKIGEHFGIHLREVGSAEEILANVQKPE